MSKNFQTQPPADQPATPEAFFAACWARNDDPWNHGTRWSETRKYALTISALPLETYRRAFEPACGSGVLTALLAARAPQVIAMERELRGVTVASDRCSHLPGVEVRRGCIPVDWPEGAFDLIVLSEVLYYLSHSDVDEVLQRSRASIEPGGHVVAVHHRQPLRHLARPGDEVHRLVAVAFGAPLIRHVEENFLLDVFSVEA